MNANLPDNTMIPRAYAEEINRQFFVKPLMLRFLPKSPPLSKWQRFRLKAERLLSMFKFWDYRIVHRDRLYDYED